jgi:hypothetical protein
MTDQRRPVPASGDGRESFAPRLCRLEVEGQGDLFSDSRTTPAGIALLHFDDRIDELCTRPLRAGLATAIGGEQHAVLLPAHGLVKP